MNKQLEEAIKNIKEFIEDYKIAEEFVDGNFIDDLETVLSMLKEKDTEIEGLKRLQEETIEKDKIREKIEEMQKEYNKLDKQVDEYINDSNKNLNKYYENREKISTMQTIGWAIGKIEELLEGE